MSGEVNGRLPGLVLIGAAGATIVGMLHHPTGHGSTGEELAESLVYAGPMLRLVHGAMIALLLAMTYGVTAHANRRGLDKPLVLLGLVTFIAGIFVMLPAPLLDGFVFADFAAQAQRSADAMAAFPAVSLFAMDLLLAFAKASSVLISSGIALLSVGMMHERGAARWLGIVGVITALPGGIAILAGHLQLDRQGMTLMVVCWSVWFVGLGVQMIRGKA
ncbi:MAG: hypothetical protein ABL871_06875 [Terricaulis sp.]